MRLLSLSEASIQKRTSTAKFARSPCTDRPGIERILDAGGFPFNISEDDDMSWMPVLTDFLRSVVGSVFEAVPFNFCCIGYEMDCESRDNAAKWVAEWRTTGRIPDWQSMYVDDPDVVGGPDREGRLRWFSVQRTEYVDGWPQGRSWSVVEI